MGVKKKLYDRLDVLECQFQQDLIDQLPDVVAGRNSLLFDSSRYSVLAELHHCDLSQADQLMSAADEIIRVRGQLGESVDSSLALRFQTTCRDYSDTSNHHRPGCRNLAQSLLEHINAS